MKKSDSTLKGKKIALLVTDGFEESEMASPRAALIKAGAKTYVITLKGTKVRSWKHGNWSKTYKADSTIAKMAAREFDALVLPGGVMNPDNLRAEKTVIKFVDHFVNQNKPIAAICHGPWTLIETGMVKGKTMTSYATIKTDLINAGAKWVNKKVVRDKNLITSRSPDDLPAFNKAIVKMFAE